MANGSKVSRIFVAYETILRPGLDLQTIMPSFEASWRTKDPEKIDAEIAAKQAKFLTGEGLDAYPYTGTFRRVMLLDPSRRSTSADFCLSERMPGSGKPSVAAAVSDWLAKHYPDAFKSFLPADKYQGAVFVGFDTRRFLKMLGLECSLPSVGRPLPPGAWYETCLHRDIESAVLPSGERGPLDWRAILHMRAPLMSPLPMAEGANPLSWPALVDNWEGPHVHAPSDLFLAIELASQLGFLND